MKPDSRQQKDADYFRVIVAKTNLTQRQLAKKIGINDRSIRRYLLKGAPYPIQFAVECLVYASD